MYCFPTIAHPISSTVGKWSLIPLSLITLTLVKGENIQDGSHHFILDASCRQQKHSHQRRMLVLKVRVDDTKNIIKLVECYVCSSTGATLCDGGDVQVNVSNTIYRCNIGKMKGSILLLKGNEVLTIYVNCRLTCFN